MRPCPICQAPAQFVAFHGAPGIGEAWTCERGHNLVRLGGELLDPSAYTEEPPWIANPEDER
jgi:hypothetical protein